MDVNNITGITPELVDSSLFDDRPGPYCMSFYPDLASLSKSIQEVGLLNSPLIREEGEGDLAIISGYRRILALKTLAYTSIPCRVMKKSEISPLNALLANLYENLASRPLNEVEKGMVLSRLVSYLPRARVSKEYMALLALSSHRDTLDFYVELDEGLEDVVKKEVVKGNISLPSVRVLLEMDGDSRLSLCSLMKEVKFNLNQQSQLLEYLDDLCNISGKSIPSLLEETEVRGIIMSNRLNSPQKAKNLLRLLRAKRFPTLVQAEQAFNRKVSMLNLPDGVKVNVPAFFEGPNYELRILFKEGEELRGKLHRISESKGLGELSDPWEDK